LLGDTILVSDEEWRAPSRLPDWTRGHVATREDKMKAESEAKSVEGVKSVRNQLTIKPA